jgi:hypothetical protein
LEHARRVKLWFTKSEASPEVPPPVIPADRVAEALKEVQEAKRQLDAINATMLRFKTKNAIRTDRFGRLLGVECVGIGGRAPIEREWRLLLGSRDAAVDRWDRALREWSQAKMEAAK